jgi:hypothetical protein
MTTRLLAYANGGHANLIKRAEYEYTNIFDFLKHLYFFIYRLMSITCMCHHEISF